MNAPESIILSDNDIISYYEGKPIVVGPPSGPESFKQKEIRERLNQDWVAHLALISNKELYPEFFENAKI